MQAALVEVTQRTGIRACGPNCEGYFNALGKIATTFSPTVEVKEDESQVLVSQRRIGVIAQSGGIGFALFNRGKAAGIGFSYVISTGNEADLNMADFLDYMVEDPEHARRHAVLRGGTQRPCVHCRTRQGARTAASRSSPSRSAARMPVRAHPHRTPHRCQAPTPPIAQSSNVMA